MNEFLENRTKEQLIRSAHHLLKYKYRRSPLWVFVKDLVQCGCTSAHEICRDFGWNPSQGGAKQLPRRVDCIKKS